jgi:hypothetical protein
MMFCPRTKSPKAVAKQTFFFVSSFLGLTAVTERQRLENSILFLSEFSREQNKQNEGAKKKREREREREREKGIRSCHWLAE